MDPKYAKPCKITKDNAYRLEVRLTELNLGVSSVKLSLAKKDMTHLSWM